MDKQEQRNGAQMGQESGRKSDFKEKKTENEEKVFPFWSMWLTPTEGRDRGDEGGQKYGTEQQGDGGRVMWDDGEGVRTEKENWEGEWVMGLEGANGEEGMKVKKGRQQAKFAPMNWAACRFMWCCGYHCAWTKGDGETRAMRRPSVSVRLSVYALQRTFILPQHVAHVSSKAN